MSGRSLSQQQPAGDRAQQRNRFQNNVSARKLQTSKNSSSTSTISRTQRTPSLCDSSLPILHRKRLKLDEFLRAKNPRSRRKFDENQSLARQPLHSSRPLSRRGEHYSHRRNSQRRAPSTPQTAKSGRAD